MQQRAWEYKGGVQRPALSKYPMIRLDFAGRGYAQCRVLAACAYFSPSPPPRVSSNI